MADSPIAVYPYTEEQIARGFTVAHGRDSSTRQVPIPEGVLVVIELRRIAESLEALVAQRGE